MKKNVTTAAVKAAKNTTTAAKVAKETAAKMDAAAILEAAKDAAKGCNTCKDVAGKFDALVAKYGKINAVAIQAAAKQIIKDAASSTKDAAKDAREYLSNGATVARAAWTQLISESDRNGATFARVIFDGCGRNLNNVITRFASYVATVNGATVAIVKQTRKDENGATVAVYKPRNLATVAGYLAALKLAINNAKRAALGEPRAKWQKEIDAAAVVNS